jgi:hypothetical protein
MGIHSQYMIDNDVYLNISRFLEHLIEPHIQPRVFLRLDHLLHLQL